MLARALARLRRALGFDTDLFVLPTVAASVAFVGERILNEPVVAQAFSFYQLSTDAARDVMGIVPAATITIMSITFSITVVAVQNAASQYTPRFLSQVRSDPIVRGVVALAIGTTVFGVAGARTVASTSIADVRSAIAFVGVVLFVASVLGIVGFIRHVFELLEATRLVQHVAGLVGTQTLRDTDPDELAAEDLDELPDRSGWTAVGAPSDGWISEVDPLLALDALPDGASVAAEVVPGGWVLEGQPVLRHDAPSEQVDPQRLLRALRVDDVRSLAGDRAYGIRLLVDIALRALSPAINDPTTAVEAMGSAAAVLRRLLEVDEPAAVLVDGRHRRLLRVARIDHAELITRTYGQLRGEASDYPGVVRAVLHQMHALVVVLDDDAPWRASLEEQAALMIDAVDADDAVLDHDVEQLRATARKLGFDPAARTSDGADATAA